MSHQPPTFESLPVELHLGILSRISYFDLLRMSAVLMRFRRLLKDRAFDRARFLDTPSSDELTTPRRGSEFRIHPAFDAIIWNPIRRFDECYVTKAEGLGNQHITPTNPKLIPIAEASLLYQNATSPAVSKVTLRFHKFWQFIVTPSEIYGANVGSGVRIIYILEGIEEVIMRGRPLVVEDRFFSMEKWAYAGLSLSICEVGLPDIWEDGWKDLRGRKGLMLFVDMCNGGR